MIELTGFADIFRAIGVLYWVVVLIALRFALTKPRSRSGKVVASLAVLLVFLGGPAERAWELHQRRLRHDAAMAYFEMRCKDAGEFVYRTVDGVEGLFIGNIPPSGQDQTSQYAPDVYFIGLAGKSYVDSFLEGRDAQGREVVDGALNELQPQPDSEGRLVPSIIVQPGYDWVEGIDPEDGQRYRYRATLEPVPNAPGYLRKSIERLPPGPNPPRYGIQRIDTSAPEDRAHWVAGGKLQVVDLKTGEILGEHVGFMVDDGLGYTNGGQTRPWSRASSNACPRLMKLRTGLQSELISWNATRSFVEKVLKIEGAKR